MNTEGVFTQNTIEEDFLINNGYDSYNVTPLCCVQSGNIIYGLSNSSLPKEYLGIHIADTWDILEHPDFRLHTQVIKQRYQSDLTLMKPGRKGGDIKLDSFEIWKFISLFLKGSPVSYEMLYLPAIHSNAEELLSLMKEGITNRIGKTARNMAIHIWKKDKTNRAKTAITYYRLIQAIHILLHLRIE